MKIDWKRKLTSRKFWISVASFVTLILMAAGMTEGESGQIASIIMAGATVIGYVIGEGLTDQAFLDNAGTDYLLNSLKKTEEDGEK